MPLTRKHRRSPAARRNQRRSAHDSIHADRRPGLDVSVNTGGAGRASRSPFVNPATERSRSRPGQWNASPRLSIVQRDRFAGEAPWSVGYQCSGTEISRSSANVTITRPREIRIFVARTVAACRSLILLPVGIPTSPNRITMRYHECTLLANFRRRKSILADASSAGQVPTIESLTLADMYVRGMRMIMRENEDTVAPQRLATHLGIRQKGSHARRFPPNSGS